MTDIAWHFTGPTLRDGRPVPAIGETITHEGPIVWCKSGLYAARTPWLALQNAPGNILHRVRVARIEHEERDKLVCRERVILQSMDVEHLLRRFAADQALRVAHLWQMPDVVREYLTTLDESKSNAARAAAMAADDWTAYSDAAKAVIRAAANDAAWLAAKYASMDAIWAAAWLAARDASARNAARDAAWNAAMADASAHAANEFNARVYATFNVEG